MSFKTKLKEIIDLLKQGHCTEAYARDEYGNGLSHFSSITGNTAKSFCVSGACIKLEGHTNKGWDLAYYYYDMIKDKDPTKPEKLTAWNDNHKEEVIPTLERLYDELQD